MQLTLVLSLSLTLSAANAAAILASRSSSSESLASSTATHTDHDAHASPSPAMDDNLLDKLAYVQKEETKSSPVSASPMASMRVVQSQMPSQSVQLLATVSSSISAAESTSASASASAGSHAQPLASGSEPDSDSSASSTSSESSTSNSVGAVPFTNIVAPPPPTAMASETHPYTGNPALGLVATASTPHDDANANANANSLPQPATHTSGQPFKEIAHVSSAPEAPPKPPAVGVGALDDEPEPVEDSSGPIGRNICIGIFTFLTLAAVVTCFKDKLNGAYRRFRQHRNARETGAFVNPWTPMADQTDADSEKGVAVHSEKDEMLRQDRSPSARTSVYGSVVHPLSPGGPVSPAASSNYSPSVMHSRTVPTYNRWPNQAPPVSTESLASEMTDYGRFPMPPTHPDYRYGPYVAKPQPDHVYYR